MKNIIFLLIVLFLSGCQKEKEESTLSPSDFENLMGNALPAWKNVVTREDFENLAFFKALYEKGIPELSKSSAEVKIPKVLHFIWIGPKPFPLESITNIRSWIGKHEDWTIYFWTDRPRPLPHPSMKRRFVQELELEKLADCYDATENYAEKSDLLRYEILYQQGGVYVDHDVKCLRAFDSLNAVFDLYCGLEVPFETALSSSVFPTNNLIGAKPGHPILAACMHMVKERWDRIERDYPGDGRDAVINRVAHRSFSAFGESFKLLAGKNGHLDIAFPGFYFNAPKDAQAVYARHEYKGTWFENETSFEKNTRQRLMYLSKKSNKILLFCTLMTLINGIFFLLLYAKLRKKGI